MNPPAHTVTRFAAPRARSLAWDGDSLVDWVDGGARWTLDGQGIDSSVRYAFPFDLATTLPGSGYAVIYTRLGTKGVVLKDGEIVREIDRSFYHANVYEYPVALFRLPSGRPAIVHCPEDYCRLRIDDLETGQVLATATQEAGDFFHSRLSVSPDGRWLASAGWMWHPVDDVALYDLHAALADGATLDSASLDLGVLTDRGNAAGFDARGRLLVTGDLFGSSDESSDDEGGPRLLRLVPGEPATRELRPLEFDAPFMAVGDDHLLLFAGTPCLLSIATGQQVASWPDIPVRVPGSALQRGVADVAPVACDPSRARVAIAHDGRVSILAFHVSPPGA